MSETIYRIKALLELEGRVAVHPQGRNDVQINILYPNGKNSDMWVMRYNDWRRVQIKGLGVELCLSQEHEDILNPVIDKLLYNERVNRDKLLLRQIEQLEI